MFNSQESYLVIPKSVFMDEMEKIYLHIDKMDEYEISAFLEGVKFVVDVLEKASLKK